MRRGSHPSPPWCSGPCTWRSWASWGSSPWGPAGSARRRTPPSRRGAGGPRHSRGCSPRRRSWSVPTWPGSTRSWCAARARRPRWTSSSARWRCFSCWSWPGAPRVGGWSRYASWRWRTRWPDPHLPGFLAHRGYGPERLVEHLYLSTEGIWGVPLGVSADFVYLFVLFGAVLETAGGGALLIALADRVAGRTRGGPAKTAAVASAFMGSLSGSAVANVVTTGTFTIPLMKRAGFQPFFAGGDRGGRQHGRPAHAPDHGGRRLHPGHLDEHPVRGGRDRGDHPRAAVLRRAAGRHPLPGRADGHRALAGARSASGW